MSKRILHISQSLLHYVVQVAYLSDQVAGAPFRETGFYIQYNVADTNYFNSPEFQVFPMRPERTARRGPRGGVAGVGRVPESPDRYPLHSP